MPKYAVITVVAEVRSGEPHPGPAILDALGPTCHTCVDEVVCDPSRLLSLHQLEDTLMRQKSTLVGTLWRAAERAAAAGRAHAAGEAERMTRPIAGAPIAYGPPRLVVSNP